MKEHSVAVEKHRLAALQDGVYTIAMTLLVLELKLPGLPDSVTDALLGAALLALWPKLLTWLLSFWVLALFWVSDARAITIFRIVDGYSLRLAIFRLALVSLIPFSSALIGEHGNHIVGSAVYCLHIFLLAVAQVLRNIHAVRHPLLVEWPSEDARHDTLVQSWATLVCSGVAFLLSFVVPGYSMLALLPLLATRFASHRWFRRPATLAARSQVSPHQ